MEGQVNIFVWVCITAGFILAFPYILWELWKFIKPALSHKEIKYARGSIFWVSICFFTGAAFGLQQGGYATITLIRIAATIYLAWVLIKRALAARNTQGSLFDLLFEASKPYP